MPEYLRADIASLFDDWRPGAPPAQLSAALFDGALIVLRGLAPVERLCRRARTLVEEAFETSDPVRAETCMAPASGLCRFSIDTRSIWADDLNTGRGAPNVDGYARRAHWEWFSRPSLG